MDKDFPKLPDPLKDLPKDLQKRWKRLKKHYPEGVFVVAVDQPQGRLWRVHLTGGGTVHAGIVLMWR